VQGFFFCLVSVGERSPEEGQIRRERICTLRSNGPEGGGQDARRSCQASNKQKAIRKDGLFALWQQITPIP